MELDIDERHLLRLGHGEEELQTEKDFSRFSQINNNKLMIIIIMNYCNQHYSNNSIIQPCVLCYVHVESLT